MLYQEIEDSVPQKSAANTRRTICVLSL